MPKLGEQQVPEENIVGEILLSKNKEQKLQAKLFKKKKLKSKLTISYNQFHQGLSVSMWKKSRLKCIVLTDKPLQNGISFSLVQMVHVKATLYLSLLVFSLISM